MLRLRVKGGGGGGGGGETMFRDNVFSFVGGQVYPGLSLIIRIGSDIC